MCVKSETGKKNLYSDNTYTLAQKKSSYVFLKNMFWMSIVFNL